MLRGGAVLFLLFWSGQEFGLLRNVSFLISHMPISEACEQSRSGLGEGLEAEAPCFL